MLLARSRTLMNAWRTPFKAAKRKGLLGWVCLVGLVMPSAAQTRDVLPPEVDAALRRTALDRTKLAIVIQEVGTLSRPRVLLHSQRSLNPASLEKLFTTQAALDVLGPAWQWSTPVWIEGSLEGEVLQGRIVIKGTGDPKFTVERVWLVLQRLRQWGVRSIQGDIVLDQAAFDIPEVHPGQFDNEPLRPYNVRPQALLFNQKSLGLMFTPIAGSGQAVVSLTPPLEGVLHDTRVPVVNEACQDWRARLAPVWDDPARVRFNGALPQSCGEKLWPIAYGDPATYHERMIRAMWVQAGGTLEGSVRESRTAVPLGIPTAPPSFEVASPPLAEVVRDINKYSNNTMAQQLFLTLSLRKKGVGTWAGSREVVQQWLTDTVKAPTEGLMVDNGAGLSRESRTTAVALSRVLQHAWRASTMPDFMASLPASGIDGTLRRSQAGAGRAHLKTGSLRDVAGVAGYVLGASGRRYVLVALVNQEGAGPEARRFFDALVVWTADD